MGTPQWCRAMAKIRLSVRARRPAAAVLGGCVTAQASRNSAI